MAISSVSPRAPRPSPPAPLPRAFTLIEMLVVVSIMMILVMLAATMMRPASESRRIREAARAVNVYLSSARNRAMETGRPCGVMLRRFSATIPCAMNLDQCEVPPCYCGDTEQSAAQITVAGNDITVNFVNAGSGAAEQLPDCMVRENDLIQFGSQGPMYKILRGANGTGVDPNAATFGYILTTASITATLFDTTQAPSVPWSATPITLSYRIYRSPMKGSATPLQLPASTVVDLNGSGIDPTTTFNPVVVPPPGDIIILFAPNGSIDRVYINGDLASPYVVTNPIFLLIGKRERVGNEIATPYDANDQATWANWRDLNNVWIVINPQTGLVSTGEVAPSTALTAAQALTESRTLARDAQSMGGK